jgi:hypothetical protein
VRADDLLEGNTADPERHPIANALRRQNDVDDARVTKNETLVRRGKKWFRYDAPDKRLVSTAGWQPFFFWLTALYPAACCGVALAARLKPHGAGTGLTKQLRP